MLEVVWKCLTTLRLCQNSELENGHRNSWYSNAINHPPFITIFMNGINHQKWVVYGIAIPTLLDMNRKNPPSKKLLIFIFAFRSKLDVVGLEVWTKVKADMNQLDHSNHVGLQGPSTGPTAHIWRKLEDKTILNLHFSPCYPLVH